VTGPAPRGRPHQAAGIVGFLALAVAISATCTKIPTDPTLVFSLAVDSLPGPSVVAGDTLRDTNGVATPLSGRAYNIQNQVLPNVHVQFLSLSPDQLTVSAKNFAIGTASGDSIVRVLADANGLQSLPFNVPVVLKPNNLVFADSDSISSAALSLTTPDSDVSAALNVLLIHQPDTVGADSVTRSYIVHYQITYPASAAKGMGTPSDSTLPAYLIEADGQPSRTDTTDGNGMGSRVVHFSVAQFQPKSVDSIVVMATAVYRDSVIAGSPRRFVIHYTAP
jgi:hypothetical protein